METLFLKLLNMSLTGAAVILAVCLLRLALRRSPKAISYALWAVVLFRLLCPVSLSSELSAFNLVSAPVRGVSAAASAVEFVEPGAEGPAPVNVPEMAEQAAAERVPAPAKGPEPAELAAWVWLAGALAMACWGLASYLRLRRRLVGAVPLGGGVFASDYIGTPFVLGLFRPRIYLPSSLPERERGYILLHERRHIRRLDPLFRLLGFAALCLHWFNPLVWLAFVLSGRDMEMSCDEAVLRTLGEGVRADYSVSLLRLVSGGRPGPCMSLAFGELEEGGGGFAAAGDIALHLVDEVLYAEGHGVVLAGAQGDSAVGLGDGHELYLVEDAELLEELIEVAAVAGGAHVAELVERGFKFEAPADKTCGKAAGEIVPLGEQDLFAGVHQRERRGETAVARADDNGVVVRNCHVKSPCLSKYSVAIPQYNPLRRKMEEGKSKF